MWVLEERRSCPRVLRSESLVLFCFCFCFFDRMEAMVLGGNGIETQGIGL